MQVSYDLVNLCPPVRIDKVINVLEVTLDKDKEQLKKHTKLTSTDISELTEFCLSKCYFLYESNIHLFQSICTN